MCTNLSGSFCTATTVLTATAAPATSTVATAAPNNIKNRVKLIGLAGVFSSAWMSGTADEAVLAQRNQKYTVMK